MNEKKVPVVNKLANVVEIALPLILGVIFLPVLFCIIFMGTNMDYNEGLKLVTLRKNWILFLVAVPVLALSVFLIHICSKYPLKKRGNFIANVVLSVLCAAVYFLSVRIAREIAFDLPWDIGVVASVATQNVAEQVPVGYFYYLSVYTNNLPIVYILGGGAENLSENFRVPTKYTVCLDTD